MSDLTMFHGPNAGYVLELYDRYRQDPQSVDAATRTFFESLTPPAAAAPAAPAAVAAAPSDGAAAQASPLDVAHTVGAARLIRYIRELGHMAARIDPLGGEPPGDPGLELSIHNVTEEDLAALPAEIVRGPLVEGSRNALEAFEKLRRAYAGTIGYETDHIHIFEERA